MAIIRKASAASYDDAIKRLKAGEPVALPTETVYGLATLASDDKAVVRVYRIKGRSSSKPFSVVVNSFESTAKIAEISPMALSLMKAFWPGPLTLVLPLKPSATISKKALAGGNTIGLRCPDIDWMAYFTKTGFHEPLVLPSANASGNFPPISALDVDADIGEKIPLIVNGGVCKTGIESTIIAVENDSGRVLRHGAIPPEDLAPFRLDWNSV